MNLIDASRNGNLVRVIELLTVSSEGIRKECPDVVDDDGNTPLLWASRSGRLDIVKELLHADADPNIADRRGRTPLFWAARGGYWEVVEELETYFPSLRDLSLRRVRRFKIVVSAIPEKLLE